MKKIESVLSGTLFGYERKRVMGIMDCQICASLFFRMLDGISAGGILEIAMTTKVRSAVPLENKGRKEEKVKWPISACKCVACERERERAYATRVVVRACVIGYIHLKYIYSGCVIRFIYTYIYIYARVISSSIVGIRIFWFMCQLVHACACVCVKSFFIFYRMEQR